MWILRTEINFHHHVQHFLNYYAGFHETHHHPIEFVDVYCNEFQTKAVKSAEIWVKLHLLPYAGIAFGAPISTKLTMFSGVTQRYSVLNFIYVNQ
jgi:hypothetical protein